MGGVKRVRYWLRTASARTTIPGSARIWKRYERFEHDFTSLCDAIGLDIQDLAFADYSNVIVQWLKENAPAVAGSVIRRAGPYRGAVVVAPLSRHVCCLAGHLAD